MQDDVVPREPRAPTAGLAATINYWATQNASIRPRRDHWEAHPVVKSAMIERRGAIGPVDWLARRLSRTPLRALSVGAGAGLFELDLVGRGAVTSFDLMDVTPQLMQSASETAAAQGLGDRVRCLTADINRVELEPESYDLITFVSALHHVENLEHVSNSASGRFVPAVSSISPSTWARIDSRFPRITCRSRSRCIAQSILGSGARCLSSRIQIRSRCRQPIRRKRSDRRKFWSLCPATFRRRRSSRWTSASR